MLDYTFAADLLFSDLNPKQIEAVKHFRGPALVVAGPGSGKTRVLTHRIAYLIGEYNVPEINILCVTFTNKAAAEVKQRVTHLLSGNNLKLTWSGTFHSVCSRILRKEGYLIGIPPSFVIYDKDDQVSLVKGIIKDFGIDPKKVRPYGVLELISSAKSELVDAVEYPKYVQGNFQKEVARIYLEYQRRLHENNALDFDDLLCETISLFEKNPHVLDKYRNMFEYILVDEYQDTNKAQYVLTKVLSEPKNNLFVVGDMSQAIYSFRGADYRNILNFENDFPEATVYNLEQNYRSTQPILDAAKSIIKNNDSHIHLDLWTNKKEGEKLVVFSGYSDRDEVSFVVDNIRKVTEAGKEYKDIAVLYRTNAQSRLLEEAMIKSSIPYKIVGGLGFYSRKEIKDITAYLRVIHNPKDTVSWERIINVPPRGIGKKRAEYLKNIGWNLEEIEKIAKIPIKLWLEKREKLTTLELMEQVLLDTGYIEWLDDGSGESKYRVENILELKSVAAVFNELSSFLENVALIESSSKVSPEKHNAVTLMTVHASKGLEFAVIFIVGMEEGLFPHAQSMFELKELEEERRLCYVAITRAKEKVYLSNAQVRLYFGNLQQNMPSRFLSEIPVDLIQEEGFSGSGFAEKGYDKNLNGKNSGKKSYSIEKFLDDLDFDRHNFYWD